jgi:hypothetical protein
MPKHKPSKLLPREYAQSVSSLALLAGAILTYVTAEIVLATRPHPYHWVTALAGGLLVGGVVYGVAFWQRTHLG